MAKTDSLTDTRTVTLELARRELAVCMRKKRPVFLWGAPGIGKSELVAQITEDLGGKLYDLRLALMDPSDLKGVLYYNPTRGDATWSAPPDLPTKEEAAQYPVVVLFLDEMNSAAPATQAAAYQLVLNRRVGTYELPDNCVIVAAGNRESDRGVTYRMPAPLANRFVHLTLRPDYDTWFQWAIQNSVHKDVVGYITGNKVDLFNFDPKAGNAAFATPRSWTFVSELLDEEMSDNELMDLVSGTVGEGVALKFAAHRKVASKMPNPTDILTGKVTELKNKDISAMYSLCVSLCYEIKEDFDNLLRESGKSVETWGSTKQCEKWHSHIDNAFTYAMANFETELQVNLAFSLIGVYKLPLRVQQMKTFKDFNSKVGSYVLAATQQGK